MSGQSAAFTSDIPRLYDRYLGPFLFEPYARDIAERARALAPRRVLEIACGTGIVTAALRHALPNDVELVATDLSADMLDFARRKLGDAAVRWEIADGARLPFDDASFDVVVCQFGYMFFPDKVAGFREARRVLNETGTLLFSVWSSTEENPYGRIVHETLAEFFEIDPPQFYNVPFGYHDESRIRADLAAGGFSSVQVEAVDFAGEASSARELAIGAVRGSPAYHAIAERGKDHAAIETEVARRLVTLGGDAPFRTPLHAKVITARR